MKARALLSSLALGSALASCEAPAAALGQPNMAGYPKAQDADEVEDPRIQVLGYDDCAATGPYDGGCAGHNTLVNMLPAAVTNGHVVSADGLALDPADTMWRLHFGHDAQVTFGQRYAAQMIAALEL